MYYKWIYRYLDLAKEISLWSKDPSTKVGAITVGGDGQILSQGFNGFPRGVIDTEERYADRDEKYKYVVHAELNCIFNATLNGVSLKDSSMYVWGLPVCNECAKAIIQVGIEKVYWPQSIAQSAPDKWKESVKLTKDMFDEAGIDWMEVKGI